MVWVRGLRTLSKDEVQKTQNKEKTCEGNWKWFGMEKITACVRMCVCVCAHAPTGESWETGRGWIMGRFVDHI